MLKKIKILLLYLLLMFILSSATYATRYSIDIEPDIEKNQLNLEIIIRDINNSESHLITITHPPYFVSNKGVVGEAEGINVPEIIITPGIKLGKTILFSEEGFKPESIGILEKRKEELEGELVWHEFNINLTELLNRSYDSYLIQINGLGLPGIFTYKKDRYPFDYGYTYLFFKIPESSIVDVGFKVEQGYVVISQSSKFALLETPSTTLIFNESNAINATEGYTKQNLTSGEPFRVDEQKNYIFKTPNKKGGYMAVFFKFIRPEIYGKFFYMAILLIIFFALVALILRDFRVYLTIFMFLLALYNLFRNMSPTHISTLLLDKTIIDIFFNIWFISGIFLTPLFFLFFGTHSKKINELVIDIKNKKDKIMKNNPKANFITYIKNFGIEIWVNILTYLLLIIVLTVFIIHFIRIIVL